MATKSTAEKTSASHVADEHDLIRVQGARVNNLKDVSVELTFADAARVHLAEADELRTHAWPELHELSSVELVDDFVASYAGAVIGHHIYVDGAEADSGDDAVMRFDPRNARGGANQPYSRSSSLRRGPGFC